MSDEKVYADSAFWFALATSVLFVLSELLPFLPTEANGVLDAAVKGVAAACERGGSVLPR
jgi:hypothetical protein